MATYTDQLAASPPGPGPDDAAFSAAVAAVTSAFGDPTRRRIYLFVRESPEGVTAAEVAERFALHSNVARHHLDKLTAGGYLEVHVARAQGGGAGRPSKRYRSSAEQAGLSFPPLPRRGDDLLIMLLGEALSRLPQDQAEAMAERVGEEYGRRLADQMSPGEGHRSFRVALHAIADALTAHGFEAHAEARGGSLALIKDACPFFDTARQHPVICAVDRGMVRGMLTGLYGGDATVATESSRALGDDTCVSVSIG
ncbi:MAG: helix-turn-helix domain-containing protein [Acidobacteriota bacterium]|nr:helix-turn-helix domain-containing protein [Acidobacteriota bacterium]